jgi:acetylornithine deacetylase/succinyl-diaminopimelate desuccinylase-like protein
MAGYERRLDFIDIGVPRLGAAVDRLGRQKTEILTHYRDLIRIDTRAGNETKAVDYIRQVLEGDGIPSETFALDPARANLVARIKDRSVRC